MNWKKSTVIKLSAIVSITAAVVSTGCAITTLKEAQQSDPWQGWNKNMQSFNDGFDKHIYKPLAQGYLNITNDAVDEAVTNFFSNINDIGVTINDILQLKLLQGGMDISRFIINSTAGIAGIFDWASKIDLPKHNEDVGQTLGFWGVPSGPYLVLPFFGPSTPTDTIGLLGDALLDPLTYTFFFNSVLASTVLPLGAAVLDATDYRAGLMTSEKIVDEGAVGDRYDFIKSSYLQHREYVIHDGNLPEENELLPEDDEPL
jgi:phospholipid-binding lipoprotein MlaA